MDLIKLTKYTEKEFNERFFSETKDRRNHIPEFVTEKIYCDLQTFVLFHKTLVEFSESEREEAFHYALDTVLKTVVRIVNGEYIVKNPFSVLIWRCKSAIHIWKKSKLNKEESGFSIVEMTASIENKATEYSGNIDDPLAEAIRDLDDSPEFCQEITEIVKSGLNDKTKKRLANELIAKYKG